MLMFSMVFLKCFKLRLVTSFLSRIIVRLIKTTLCSNRTPIVTKLYKNTFTWTYSITNTTERKSLARTFWKKKRPSLLTKKFIPRILKKTQRLTFTPTFKFFDKSETTSLTFLRAPKNIRRDTF